MWRQAYLRSKPQEEDTLGASVSKHQWVIRQSNSNCFQWPRPKQTQTSTPCPCDADGNCESWRKTLAPDGEVTHTSPTVCPEVLQHISNCLRRHQLHLWRHLAPCMKQRCRFTPGLPVTAHTFQSRTMAPVTDAPMRLPIMICGCGSVVCLAGLGGFLDPSQGMFAGIH